MAEEFPEFDLLGDPWREPRGRPGRKRHLISEEKRWKVIGLRADGQAHKDIALALGISEPTLREYYFRELRHGPAMLRGKAMVKLCELALGEGKPAALKLLFARLDAGDTLPTMVAAPLGKKEQLSIDAESGHEGTVWGNLLPN